ncbi:MAG: protein kinase domain-containing protein [Aquabacterium sp.]
MSARDAFQPTPAAAAAGLPERIGRYRVQARIGEGATSEVFLGHDDFRDRPVAIKRVRQDLLADSFDLRYQEHFFAAEAALAGRLQHPNVVQILDAVADDPLPYIVMEYVPGDSLRRFCRPDSLLGLAQVVEIGFKCAMALGYMFRQGLIHRDVKPANILAVFDEHDALSEVKLSEIKVSDFGSVFDLRAERTQVFRVGSLAYMSPQQLDGDTADARSDIYSLSAVLYHLVAGRPPFDAEQPAVLMNQICVQPPPPLSALREGVPPALERLILSGLEKELSARPANWDAFAAALSDLAASPDLPRGNMHALLDAERFALLRGLDFFAGFGDVELWEVVHRALWQRWRFGDALYRKGELGNTFHILCAGGVDIYRDGTRVAQLGAGTSVGEMAYLAPNPLLRSHAADVIVRDPAVTVAFTPEALDRLSPTTRHRFDKAFIQVLVRRLHAAHEALHHPQRIL